MALTIATAIFGPGFRLHEPKNTGRNCRFLCFTDRGDLQSESWEIVRQSHGLSPRRSNRHVKALLHRYVVGPTLYVDSEFQVTADPWEFVGEHLEGRCWAATRHPIRDCLFDEAEFCLLRNRIESADKLRAQVDRYRAAGIPEHFGLWAGGVLARRGDQKSALFGEYWWSEICAGSERDQVSLSFVVWLTGLVPGEIAGGYTALPGLLRRKSLRKYL